MIKEGEDPNRHKKAARAEAEGRPNTTFEVIGREWHGKQIWAKKHTQNILRTLEADVFPSIGHIQIDKVSAQDIISILQDIEKRDAIDVAKRVNQRCVAIFEYAIGKNLCAYNPAVGRTAILKKQTAEHRPSLKADQLHEFMNKLEEYSGGKVVQLAMKLLILTFLRPGELRNGRWDEIDEKKAEWRIPKERMKGRKGQQHPHVVPLSNRAMAVLKELHEITGKAELLFPGERGVSKPISDVTLLKALKIMGYVGDKKIVPHGMRHTASTILHESGFKTEVVEAQMAHKDKNRVRATYNHALYLEERKQMMGWWADFLDAAAQDNKVIIGRFKPAV